MSEQRSLTAPGLVLGVGLGGFIDGIFLHQLLQWHHLVSRTIPPDTVEGLQRNVVWDGLLHAFSWLAVGAGLLLLWRAVRDGRPGTWSSLTGWIVAGWGTFNVVEGIVNHHVLQVHRVRPDAANPLAWDLGFLAVSAGLIVGGWVLASSDGRRPEHARRKR